VYQGDALLAALFCGALSARVSRWFLSAAPPRAVRTSSPAWFASTGRTSRWGVLSLFSDVLIVLVAAAVFRSVESALYARLSSLFARA
jgi:hypothetical protein